MPRHCWLSLSKGVCTASVRAVIDYEYRSRSNDKTSRDNMADYRTVKADSLINVVRSIVKAGGSADLE